MNNALRPLIAFILIVVSPCAMAQTLWGGTVYGMSLEQVKAAVPNAKSPNGKPGTLKGGAQEQLRVEDIEIVNQKFAASFYFLDGKLTQVTLSLSKPRSFEQTLLVFDRLTEALRAKYGQELNRQIRRGDLNIAKATWLAGRTNISVVALSVGRNNASLNIAYQVRVAREGDKL
jgi:hypothetical protein